MEVRSAEMRADRTPMSLSMSRTRVTRSQAGTSYIYNDIGMCDWIRFCVSHFQIAYKTCTSMCVRRTLQRKRFRGPPTRSAPAGARRPCPDRGYTVPLVPPRLTAERNYVSVLYLPKQGASSGSKRGIVYGNRTREWIHASNH